MEDAEKNDNVYEMVKVQISSLEKKLENYDNYFSDIYLDLKKEKINEGQYNKIKSRLEEEKKDIIKRLDELKRKLSSSSNRGAKEKDIIKFINEYLSFEKPPKELLVLLIDRVEIDETKKIDIYFNFKI